MRIELARIDDRFIHGQVLTKWVKLRPIDRIIIVSDSVAADEMRKTLVLSASAVSVDKMIRAYKSPRYETTTAMLLFENPQDIVRLVEGGVDLKEVNVGGMRFDVERKQITKSVSVNDSDIAAFRKLKDLGVKNELRQLPGDTSQDFNDILENALKS